MRPRPEETPLAAAAVDEVDSSHSWVRLAVAVVLSSIGGVGMWSVVVALPAVQAEFGVARADASLPYTLVMLGFAVGGVVMGRFADRRGIIQPVVFGSIVMALGYIASGYATTLWQFALLHGVMIGLLGSSATFAPLIADVSRWFLKRRGIAVTVCASGNYIAGFIWPRVIQHFIDTAGWRATHIGIGLFCLATMLPLSLMLRRPAPPHDAAAGAPVQVRGQGGLGLSPRALQWVLVFAGLACCLAMSMPQVHIVAYCGDLGYGVARGAEMLSLMLGFGIFSRVASGFIADRVGGLATLLLGSALQGLALLLYLVFDGLWSLYVISALFGLFQGGIVPSYAIIVREYFAPNDAGTRVGLVLMATLFGMAIGGWLSGAIFDWTGSYAAAFANGAAWNLLNVVIVGWLLYRAGGPWAVGRARRVAAAAS
ncbi:MAG: MFS transporter [Alphaproteobacteria bacterium]|nr:MFS transporter [Alphaproteobacteria bacterium]